MFIISFLELFIKYVIFYIYLYLVGRSLFVVVPYLNKNKINNKLLYVDSDILYPLFGFIIFGNGLFIINTLLPLDSIYVVIFVALLIAPAITKAYYP